MTGLASPHRAARGRRGRRAWAFDVALALLATCVELVGLLDDGSASTPALVLTVVAGGALVVRRSAPVAVLAIVTAAAVAIVGLSQAPMDEAPTGLCVLIGLYTTAVLCELRVSLAALAPTVAVVTALSVATAGEGDVQSSGLVGAVTAAVLTIGIWGLGAYAQTRRRYTRELEERAAQVEREREQLARIAVHEERASIARELHDIVAHSVSVMLVGVRGARDVLRTSPDVAADTLARVETSGEQSLAELRRILAVLRKAERGAESRPQPSLLELEDLVADYRDAGLPVRLEVTGEVRGLPGGVELSVYRIVQEALTNVLKHADPTRVTVTLSFRGAGLEVEVVDDGTAATANGSAAQPAAAGRGHGIVGMRERVALLGGELETGSRGGGGFRVAARLPVGDDA